MPDDREHLDKEDAPGPEGQADGQTQQDAGLDGGSAQAAQGDDERVGADDADDRETDD